MVDFNNRQDKLTVEYVDRADLPPFVSVIVPMLHNSGRMLHAAESLVNQTYPQDRFEIVVVSKKDRSDMEMDVRARLRLHDVVIFDPTRDYYTAMNSGARAAKGDILIFAESHVTCEPNCLEEMVNYLEENPQLAGASSRVLPGNVGILPDMQVELYAENDVPHLQDPEHWRKIATRLFSLRRSVYVSHGPFEQDFGLFSERAAAIRFKELDLKFGYCDRAYIRHYDVDRLEVLSFMTRNYVIGECLYRDRFPEYHCDKYLGTPPLWQSRMGLEKKVGELRAQALLKGFLTNAGSLRTWSHAPETMLRFVEHIHVAFFGISLLLAIANIQVRVEQVLLNLVASINRSLFRDLFRQHWHISLGQLYRLEWLAANGLAQSAESAEAQFLYSIAELESRHFAGFHLAENHNGFNFRWSEPECVLLVSLNVVETERKVTLQLLPGFVLREEYQCIRAFIDGVQLRQVTSTGAGRVEFILPASLVSKSGRHFLSVCSEAKRFPKDKRLLSLPIVSVVFNALDCDQSEVVRSEQRELQPV
jgi:glycosyltransferase involved in cell wall biosynthesis